MYVSLDIVTDKDIIQNCDSSLLAEGTTLLSYEMGWQLRLFDLMAASQQSNDYVMACTYGTALLHILDVENIPERQLSGTKSDQQLESWQRFYTEILMKGVVKIKDTINAVRDKYKPDQSIPKYKTPGDKKT